MPRKINTGPKIQEEKETITLMVHLYCRKKHKTKDGLCPDCQAIHDYAQERLDYCRFGEEKTTCKNCPVHCYRRDMREAIKEVMRYAGPWMLVYHPAYTFKHYAKAFRK